jgi:photosynthetic reaction center cytochrome c subunit
MLLFPLRRGNSLLCAIVLAAALSVPGILRAQSNEKTQDKTAEQVNKNIQVFKGLPASKLRNTMFFFRYSLGVNCNFCHTFGQFELDTKPPKAKAREMIKMVKEINTNHFEGWPVVNCYTCHQGSLTPKTEIPAVRTSIQSMFSPRSAPSREEKPPALPSVDDVLNKYIEALGGKEALTKLTSRVVTGSVISAEGTVASREIDEAAPNMRLDVRRSGSDFGDFSEGFDGTLGWRKGNRGVGDLNGDQLSQAQMDAQFNSALRMKDLYTKLAVSVQEKTETEPANVVTGLSTITGKRERFYFGAQTGLLLRRSVVTENFVGSIATDTYYEDYRVVDGIKTPMLVSEYSPDSGSIMKINRVQYNVAIDAGKFKKPVN